jgi:predicted metalloendopeptidase
VECRSPEYEYILRNMDLNADPCEDFYQYTCGNWANTTKIPEGKDQYSTFDLLLDSNRENIIKVSNFLSECDHFPSLSRGN